MLIYWRVTILSFLFWGCWRLVEDGKTPKTPKLVTLESAMSMVSRPAKRSAGGKKPMGFTAKNGGFHASYRGWESCWILEYSISGQTWYLLHFLCIPGIMNELAMLADVELKPPTRLVSIESPLWLWIFVLILEGSGFLTPFAFGTQFWGT